MTPDAPQEFPPPTDAGRCLGKSVRHPPHGGPRRPTGCLCANRCTETTTRWTEAPQRWIGIPSVAPTENTEHAARRNQPPLATGFRTTASPPERPSRIPVEPGRGPGLRCEGSGFRHGTWPVHEPPRRFAHGPDASAPWVRERFFRDRLDSQRPPIDASPESLGSGGHQPPTSDSESHRRTGPQEAAIPVAGVERPPTGHLPEQRREPRHGQHRADAERRQISYRLPRISKPQRGQHSEKMGTTGQSVQDPDPDGRMPVAMLRRRSRL